MKKCVSIIDFKDINKANKTKADILELRTDLYNTVKTEQCSVFMKIISKCQKPVIVKIIKNKKLLQQAIDLNVDYIDLDYKDVDARVVVEQCSTTTLFNKTKLIVSYHDFQKTPDFKFLNNLVKKGVNKIAVKINKIEDNLVISKLLEKYKNKIIAIGMGELGIMTRLDKRNMISYFSLNKNKISAPGQLAIDQADLKLYGIIGNPASQSLSPKIHNPAFKKHKIKALYQIWETDNLAKMMKIFKSFDLSGASVTVPYKEKIIKYLDVISKDAQNIKAVNTIISKNKKLYGDNTDWHGTARALEKYINLKNKKAVILGKGGAAKAASYGLKKHGACVIMLGRKDLKSFNQNFNILINATPVHDKMLIPSKLINKNTVVMDMIYYKKTKLLESAKRKKAKALNGLAMLKAQGEKQFFLWTKKKIKF